jgi:hypothetical protein
MSSPKFLLDINILLALGDEGHLAHRLVMDWFSTPGLNWGVCTLSEAGFMRLSTMQSVGKLTVGDAAAILAALASHPGYRFWPITTDWAELTRPFFKRIIGHQQITDACLLGLAIQEGGVLVTMDKGIKYLAGAEYSNHLLVLERPAAPESPGGPSRSFQ